MPYITLPDGTRICYQVGRPLSPADETALVRLIETALAEIAHAETARRAAIARAAFYGGYPLLDTYLRGHHGYRLDGRDYPANGASLADYCLWVAELDAADLAALCGEAEA